MATWYMRLRRALRQESENARLAHLRETLRTGLWFVPAVFVAGATVLAIASMALDRRLDGEPGWFVFNGGPTSAQQILATIVTSMLTFTGLVFTITVVTLQLASSQFSPRVLRSFLRDRGSQVSLGVFTATFVFALVVLSQVRTGAVGAAFVPRLSVSLTFGLVITSLVTFIYYVNHITQAIRVVNIIDSIAEETSASLDRVWTVDPGIEMPNKVADLGACRQVISLEGRDGVLAGLDIGGLVELARRHDCVFRLVADMGDFVANGAPLIEVLGGRTDVAPANLLDQMDFGRERSMRQDPAYGFRQLVDIAERALSPSLNDPTTAIQTIDRLHGLLRRVATRPQPTGAYCDSDGDLRFMRSIVGWRGLVTLSFEEIREYGSSSIQVHRRLRAAITDLIDVAPTDRMPPLQRQLHLLDESVRRSFHEPEERQLAAQGDESGIGTEEVSDAGEVEG
ncbi:MAG: DUF2254 domain-containing protein [Acidimicrobiia bacterium]|nr:DUF2254 domain-containing protein [Acidimicrobiia bacterium]